MTRHRKLLDRILSRDADQSIRFAELCALLISLGFSERVRGSRHIFWRDDVGEILNLQSRPDGSAKPYQVKQVRRLLLELK